MKPPRLASSLLAKTGAAHGFFGRQGGVSRGVFESLNAGLGSGDDPKDAAENRRRCAAALDVEPERLLTLRQVHSPKAVLATAPWSGQGPEADGMVTKEKGLALGVLAAAPLLFRRRAFVQGAAVATVVGSGIMAERLAGGNDAVALLGNTGATAAVLYVLIATLASHDE